MLDMKVKNGQINATYAGQTFKQITRASAERLTKATGSQLVNYQVKGSTNDRAQAQNVPK